MKKGFKSYLICWAILLALFNLICFVTPAEADGFNKFGGAFWAGYVVITLAFLGQLACAYMAFKAENQKRFFYNLPLITVSYTGLILTLVLGGLCMAIPDVPNWLGAILGAVVLAFTAVAVVKASAAADIVESVDKKVAEKTAFLRMATADAEVILNEDSTDAEAYWSLVLCRYGIEYVEDPATHKRVPTVNRAQFTSVFDDDNYKSAIQYADIAQRQLYEEEARTINEIQKGILSISQKEEPFDVFICYKETDAGGRRTPDSVLANDLYHQLTQEGFKVFFARITLEEKEKQNEIRCK